ncbi:MAG TPA: acetate uptake transporter [Solirubrobacteraceae bacterium]|nr:acetate uptake transporter [Solirubrobacteraceae bacterium]
MATVSEEGLASGRQAGASSMTGGAGWLPANPAPLGLSGFGLTTLVLSFVNANIVGGGAATFPIVLGMAIAFGGVAQLFAGMWEFRTGNTFGAVAFSSFGAFWISFFFLVSFNVAQLPKTEIDAALGLYLWMWGIFTGMLFLCTFASPRALQLLFLLLTVTFILLGIGNSGASSGMIHAGGYVGIATGAVALYIACADIMQAVYKRSVLPVG